MSSETEQIIKRMQDTVGVANRRQLAKYLSIGAQSVSSWATRNTIPYKDCVKIAIDFDVSIEYLITGKVPTSDIVKHIAKLYAEEMATGQYSLMEPPQVFANMFSGWYKAALQMPIDKAFIQETLKIYKKE